MPNGIEFEGRYAQVGTYPIGIEPMQFVEGLQRPTVQERLAVLKKRFVDGTEENTESVRVEHPQAQKNDEGEKSSKKGWFWS